MFGVGFAPLEHLTLDRKTQKHDELGSDPTVTDEVREGFYTGDGLGRLSEELANTESLEKTMVLKLLQLKDESSNAGYQEQAMKFALDDWMRVTHNVMDYQYIHDINNYVRDVQNDEHTRLNKQYNSIANDVMIKKQMYLMRQREANKLYSRVRVIMHTMLFVSAFVFLYTNLGFFGMFGYIVLSLMAFAFAIYIIMYVKISGSRRHNDWDKLYHSSGDEIETETPSVNDGTNDQCEPDGAVPTSTV